MSSNRPKIFSISHGWATKYYWFTIYESVSKGMNYVNEIKNNKLTFKKDTGTTQADCHGSTLGLNFFSSKFVHFLEDQKILSFKKHRIKFGREIVIEDEYYYLEITSLLPKIQSTNIFSQPDLSKYSKKNLLDFSTEIYYVYADFSKWDGSQLFSVNDTSHLLIIDALQSKLIKKGFKNINLEEIKYREPRKTHENLI